MPISKLILILSSIALITTLASATTDVHHYHYHTVAWPDSSSSSKCDGTVGECAAAEDEEFELDSEISRRVLATSQYISYGALDRNKVPCNQRGASYYNCQTGSQANPYSRGCTTYNRCRS
uniref:Uncharacterized protein n=1 Tax=Kalanchoe fedtschenkoi TaxID=63787 RepID=A0A7N0U6G1_KALFE